MTVFLSTLNQMGFLVLLIAIGYILVHFKFVGEHAASTLSKLENDVFIPALVLGTFMSSFTPSRLSVAWQYFLCGSVVIALSMLVGIFVAKLFSKDEYLRKIYTYGLTFANFGFMGNAVVAALFPDIFVDYLIFVIPFWILIYVWAVPKLLMPETEGKRSMLKELKKLINPMFICMVIGMIIGLVGLKLPSFISSSVTSLGNCMSPVAMLLTGMTIAKIDLRKTLLNIAIYAASVLRLIVIPIVCILAVWLIKLPYGLALCTICSVAMPLGLNTVVIPAAYEKDTSDAAGMALISHLLSCITIPIIFMLFELFMK